MELNITYKGKNYPIRKFVAQYPEFEEPEIVTIANYGLNSDLGYDSDFGKDEEDVDDQISFYVDDPDFNLPISELQNALKSYGNYLELIEEIYE